MTLLLWSIALFIPIGILVLILKEVWFQVYWRWVLWRLLKGLERVKKVIKKHELGRIGDENKTT